MVDSCKQCSQDLAMRRGGLNSKPLLSVGIEVHMPTDVLDSIVEEIFRISTPDYCPSQADVVKIPRPLAHNWEFPLKVNRKSLRFIYPRGILGNKWIHSFEEHTFMTFIVDLCSYDFRSLEDGGKSSNLMDSLRLFVSLFNTGSFIQASVIILLVNVGKFREKLLRYPLENQFPDYKDGNDADKAAKYILQMFKNANQWRLEIYSQLVEIDDICPSIARQLYAKIMGVILGRVLTDCGFL